ncbi:MAG: hypothetical protein EA384_03080 [Spirochaetaceae bacterium]|nr:MAG: hypothetical protein EA384_03080 [Spirochaetaceae bacterium]
MAMPPGNSVLISAGRGVLYSEPMSAKQLVVAAILLPLIPVVYWTVSVATEFAAADQIVAILWVYHPARLLALVGFVMMFYQFVLGTRLPVMESVAPRAKLLTQHRSLGKAGFILILVHGVIMLSADLIDYRRVIFNLPKLLGITALFLLIIAVIASWFFKPFKFQYNTWKKMHLLAYLVFPLAFFHAIMLGTTVRGYIAVRVLFVVLMLVYTAILVYRLAGSPQKKPAGGRGKPDGAQSR